MTFCAHATYSSGCPRLTGLVSYLAGNTEVTPVGRCYTNRIDAHRSLDLARLIKGGARHGPKLQPAGVRHTRPGSSTEAIVPLLRTLRGVEGSPGLP
jgi:hypothetical protein